ncbi:MAG: hybrid sensor histidine kinase/response regulator [Nitrosospira sp. 56-18]|jgi:two-component system chemotaxis sensor kinase CheA|nr:hybrid sensor histidine kinase/response regulator [Nitrosospira sp.]OJY14664.1 MAG: hybrid sensor histidine kinase/response regulator [Nitrosospira sp. 56-18]
MPTNDELLKRLLATFRPEAEAHLQVMSSELCSLEKTPPGKQHADIIETVFREVHSLKGAARAVNLTQMESVCQAMEAVFAALKNKRLPASSHLIDLLLQGVDMLTSLLAANDDAVRQKALAAPLIRQFEDVLKGLSTGPATMPPITAVVPPPPALSVSSAVSASRLAESGTRNEMPAPRPARGLGATTVRVSTAKLDSVMRQIEELLLPRLKIDQHVNELNQIFFEFVEWKKQRQQIQPALRLIEQKLAGNTDATTSRYKHELSRILGYLDAEQLRMKMLEDRLGQLQHATVQDQRMLASMNESLRRDVKEMQLLPFSSLLDVFPRFCRELARKQGKSIELVIRGDGIEIDRHILEEIRDPLIHLVRNCIDHGIEQPQVRLAKGKPAHGTITLSCSQRDSGTAEVLVSDDGAGIDIAQVKAAACRLGFMSVEEAERLDELESTLLIFHSGLSTSATVTDISGRGLGLAIVREKIERLGGGIVVKTKPGRETVFHISLPLVLANFRGVLVRAGGQLFVIPSTGVERVLRFSGEDIRTVKNRETILVDGKPVSLVGLSNALELAPVRPQMEAKPFSQALILGSEAFQIAFLVEEILGEQEVLVKTLIRPLARIRNVTGASVLGNGQVVPVLNVQDLLKSAIKHRGMESPSPSSIPRPPDEEHGSVPEHAILVVEDSITSRTLLKAILESAGYRVGTAVDGVDGYTALKTAKFDLVVSDVEMPRMDGFDLTAKIRADKQLAGLPVVLVTALESREHRERGVDAGANAYVVKSGFDQSNLLEIIRRLLRF